MKKLAVALSIVVQVLTLPEIEPAFAVGRPGAPDRPAVHGMLVVGSGGAGRVYLSHLPMFHGPHDYQVIVEAVFAPATRALYLADAAAHPGQRIYTLVPEPLVLPDLIAQPHPFQADLYRGHFERGGVPIAEGVTVSLGQVVYFRRFDPQAVRPARPQYLAFGDPEGQEFLAHLITAKPDFDQVLETRGVAGPLPRTIEYPAAPLPDGGAVREIYLETGDLSG